MTILLDRPEVADPELSHGEPRYAHYVDDRKATGAYIEGTPLTALCGYTWVPSRDPQKFPVCPECQRLYDLGPEGRMREQQERDGV
jgi:hypothetical protein